MNRHTICRHRPPPSVPFDLHECRLPGEWVGVTDSPVYADVIHANWIEGFHLSFTPLPSRAVQVVVKEGLCECEECREDYKDRLTALNSEAEA